MKGKLCAFVLAVAITIGAVVVFAEVALRRRDP
jgi:hypothetical protein